MPHTTTISQMLIEAEAAFDEGALTAKLPVHPSEFPEEWAPDEVRFVRQLVQVHWGETGMVDFLAYEDYPPEPGEQSRFDPEHLATLEAWFEPLDSLLSGTPLSSTFKEDVWLSAGLYGEHPWQVNYAVSPLTDRVAVLTVDTPKARTWWHPLPRVLLDRTRLMPALAEGLASDAELLLTTPFEWLDCTRSALELYRTLLVGAGRLGPEAWEMGERDLIAQRAEGDAWGLDDLKAYLGELPPELQSIVELVQNLSDSIPGALSKASQLLVCRTCGEISGEGWWKQRCSCEPQDDEPWPGYDFNTAVELCYCCGQVPLRSGSRWSIWFCEGCRKLVLGLNRSLGRYAVPIGRHSLHGGISLNGSASDLDIEIFTATFKNISEAMDRVREWSRIVVRRMVAERWPDRRGAIPLTEYVTRCDASPQERERCFGEMLAFLEEESGRSVG